MLFRKRHDTNYRDLKEAPVPEGQHLLEVDDLKMYFHTQDGVVKAVNGVSYTLDRGGDPRRCGGVWLGKVGHVACHHGAHRHAPRPH